MGSAERVLVNNYIVVFLRKARGRGRGCKWSRHCRMVNDRVGRRGCRSSFDSGGGSKSSRRRIRSRKAAHTVPPLFLFVYFQKQKIEHANLTLNSLFT